MAKSHGNGKFERNQFSVLGANVVFEEATLVFHPENIEIGDDVYVGHQTILKGYYKNKMLIEKGTWIGQQCFFHSAGGIHLGEHVGVGPGVKILTSTHILPKDDASPIMSGDIQLAPVVVGNGCDIGIGAILMPGVTLGKGVQVGAGAVVTQSVPAGFVVAGVPARILRKRQ